MPIAGLIVSFPSFAAVLLIRVLELHLLLFWVKRVESDTKRGHRANLGLSVPRIANDGRTVLICGTKAVAEYVARKSNATARTAGGMICCASRARGRGGEVELYY